jgi:hypothetical protein
MVLILVAVGVMQMVGPSILFVGNSHTATGDVPGMVVAGLRLDADWADVRYKVWSAGVLNDWAANPERVKALKNEKWDVAVLQGASISQSHKYTYSQSGGVELARRLLEKGTRVLYFSEWSRAGWDETAYIEEIYRGIQKETKGGEIVRVGMVWDRIRAKAPRYKLISEDGNHARLDGAYVAARAIAAGIRGSDRDYEVPGISHGLAEQVSLAMPKDNELLIRR